MRSVVALLLFVASLALARQPPSLPSAFHARVRSTLVKETTAFVGGGHLAVDERGYSRMHINMYDEDDKVISMHELHRDGYRYMIYGEDNQCSKSLSLSGIPFLDWIATSTFSKTITEYGITVDVWETVSDRVKNEIAIKKGTNELVRFSSERYNEHGAFEVAWEIQVLEWDATAPGDWMFYIPVSCDHEDYEESTPVGDVSGVVYFANNNWNCATAACTSRVSVGQGQPNYQCAEFVARSLAYGGFIPGLSATAPQSNYGSYTHSGTSYNLLVTTTLSNALQSIGFQKLPPSASSMAAGVAAFGDGGNGYFSHTVIGIGGQNVDAHNNARQNIPVGNDLYKGIDAMWSPSGNGSSSSSTTGSSGPSSSGPSSSGPSSSGPSSSGPSSSGPSSGPSSSGPSSGPSSSHGPSSSGPSSSHGPSSSGPSSSGPSASSSGKTTQSSGQTSGQTSGPSSSGQTTNPSSSGYTAGGSSSGSSGSSSSALEKLFLYDSEGVDVRKGRGVGEKDMHVIEARAVRKF